MHILILNYASNCVSTISINKSESNEHTKHLSTGAIELQNLLYSFWKLVFDGFGCRMEVL